MKPSLFKNGTVALCSTLASVLLLSACSAPLEQRSNLSTDSDAAVKKMEKRLAETVQVRDLAKSIEKALAPVDGALNDVMRILKGEKDRLKGALPKLAVSELRFALQSLSKEMAIEQEDGSWIIEKDVVWPFERVTEEAACSRSHVGILVRKMSDDGKAIDAEIYFRDCSSAEKLNVATIERSSAGEVKMNFNPSALENLENSEVSLGRDCAVVAYPKSEQVEVTCAPFETKVGNFTLRFGKASAQYGMQYMRSPEGESMDISIAAVKADGSPVAEFSVKQAAGEKVKMNVTRASATP